MTKLLKKAFAEANRLPEWEQDALAAMILDEIADNRQWQKAPSEADVWMEKLVEDALAPQRSIA
ncbi:MAG: hypothetical protein KBE23_13005 [Chloroflexi bacterium]|nr:hypothetical protein [Chloroflexota bacterium]MBP7043658.1 hypothetical protein [Chloroflexota bacterium]